MGSRRSSSVKIPKKLKILGQVVTVIRTDPNDDSAGYWMTKENKLFVNEAYPHTQQVTTFFHEALHAINYELPHEQVEWLAQSLAQVILDNKIDFRENL
jgi:hypothetical protein